jgi:2'-5' RNA ligase
MTSPERNFTVMAFMETHEEGTQPAHWPQHVTLTPWMTGDQKRFSKELSEIARWHDPIKVNVSDVELFGPDANRPVWILEPTDLMDKLHHFIIKRVEVTGVAAFGETIWARENFRPHITQHQDHPTYSVGDALILPHLSIVSRQDGLKSIDQHIKLGQ